MRVYSNETTVYKNSIWVWIMEFFRPTELREIIYLPFFS
ncbi:DNA polymerase V subunit UmuD, partial [Salmonella enterica]|nr:DNA polymerase V subunit UmuD [Salmonella enterica]